MSQVREVIELLTKVLKKNGIVGVKAECFRAAKFDKNEVTESLWRLLFELVYILKYQEIEEYVRDFIDQLRQEEIVVYTKYAMQEHGYLSLEFSNLPSDMSHGSRELLLAIGWLLSTKRLMDKLADLHLSPLDQEFPTQEPVVMQQQPVCTNKLGAVRQAQQLQLEKGRLCLSLKTLYSLYHEETRLQHRIHDHTAGVSTHSLLPHLSVLEVYLLRHPEHLKRFMKQIEIDNDRLESLLQWKEHEHVFWKWMESVLHLKSEEKSPTEGQNGTCDKQVLYHNIPADLLGSVSHARRNLESAIMTHEPVITHLEEIWETKQVEITADQMKKIDSAVNSDIGLHQQNVSKDDTLHHTRVYRNSRLAYVKPSQKKLSNIQISNLNVGQDGTSNPEEIQPEIESLITDIHRLEFEIQRKERFYREQLDSLASHIQDAICIQPASLRR